MAEVQEIGVDRIDRDATQPRSDFREDEMERLAKSMADVGLLQPISVCSVDGRYQLVAGERRWRAAQMLGWETILAIVVDGDSRKFRKLQMAENRVRTNLNPMELVRGLQQMLAEGMAPHEIDDALGQPRGETKWHTQILGCIEQAQHLIATGQIGPWVGWHLARLSANGQLRALRVFQLHKFNAREMVRQCERIYAQENQLEMPVDVPGKPKKQVERCPACGQRIK